MKRDTNIPHDNDVLGEMLGAAIKFSTEAAAELDSQRQEIARLQKKIAKTGRRKREAASPRQAFNFWLGWLRSKVGGPPKGFLG
jgi:hypothetical protein